MTGYHLGLSNRLIRFLQHMILMFSKYELPALNFEKRSVVLTKTWPPIFVKVHYPRILEVKHSGEAVGGKRFSWRSRFIVHLLLVHYSQLYTAAETSSTLCIQNTPVQLSPTTCFVRVVWLELNDGPDTWDVSGISWQRKFELHRRWWTSSLWLYYFRCCILTRSVSL